MKYAVIIPASAVDFPLESLGGKTALDAANVPAMQRIAQSGVVGQVHFQGVKPPSGVSPLPPTDLATELGSLLGLDKSSGCDQSAAWYAAGLEVEISDQQSVAFCDFVTLEDGKLSNQNAGLIGCQEAGELLEAVCQQFGWKQNSDVQLIPGSGFRNLLLAPKALLHDIRLTAPNLVLDQEIHDAFPRGPHSEVLCQFIDDCHQFLSQHPINQDRIAKGLPPANCLWPWGNTEPKPQPSFSEQFGKNAAMVSDDSIALGIAKARGIDRVRVVAEADDDSSAASVAQAIGKAACQAVTQAEVTLVYVTDTELASLQTSAENKVKALELIDQHIVAPLQQALQPENSARILICTDQLRSAADGKQHAASVAFAAAGEGISADDFDRWSEANGETSSLKFRNPSELLPWFFGV